MFLKFIQLNIYKGKYFGDLISFLKSESPDLVSLQEVTSGASNLTGFDDNLFLNICERTGLTGALNNDFELTDQIGSMGNAVLSKFKLLKKQVIELSPFKNIDFETSESDSFWPVGPRHVLDCTFDINGRRLHAMSMHGLWTAPPRDTSQTIRHAQIIARHLKDTKEPFILGGDFNNVIQSKTIGLINAVANNLLFNTGILETTNPQVHKIKPRGYLIDFIFASEGIKLHKLTVPKITVSDHLPIIAELEI